MRDYTLTHLIPLVLVTLALVPAPRAQVLTEWVFGLEHEPLGQAELRVEGSGEDARLVVGNIGDSGQDGVAVQTEHLDYLKITMTNTGVSDGALTLIKAYQLGFEHPSAGAPAVLGRVERRGGAYATSAAFRNASGPQRVSVYDGGLLVGQQTVDPGEPTTTDEPPSGYFTHSYSFGFGRVGFTHTYTFGYDLPDPAPVLLPDGTTLVGDFVLFEPVDPVPADPLERVEVVASGVDAFTITGEALGKFGFPHRAVGEARFDPAPDALTLTNLGGGGAHGCRNNLKQLGIGIHAYHAVWLTVGFFDPTSTTLLVPAFEEGADGEPVQWGEQRFVGLQDRVEVLVDLGYPPDTNNPAARVEVYDGGDLVGVETVPVDPLGPSLVYTIVGPSVPPLAAVGAAGSVPVPPAFENPPQPGFASRHSGGANFLFADGSVHFGDGTRVHRGVAPASEPETLLSGIGLLNLVPVAPVEPALPAARRLDRLTILGEEAASPTVVVAATPEAAPVVIPPGGGRFSWVFEAANLGDSSEQATFRTEAVLPNGTVVPLLGPRTLTLQPGAVVRRTLRQNVPGAAPAGTYIYRLRWVLPSGEEEMTGFAFEKAAGEGASEALGDWAMAGDAFGGQEAEARAAATVSVEALEVQARPNPTSGRVTLAFALEAPATVRLALYDVLGREVAAVDAGQLEAGAHRLSLDVSVLPVGVYVWRLGAGERTEAGRLTVAR